MLVLTPLNKALSSLNAALAQSRDEFVRDAVIQRFEYTYEVARQFAPDAEKLLLELERRNA